MLPSQTQRLLMIAAVAAGAAAWWWAAGRLAPADGLSGWTLLEGGTAGAEALGLIVIAGLPAVLAAALVAATGNPLSGACCLALSATVAFSGVALDGVARRAEDAGRLDHLYVSLAIESAVWFALLTAALVVIQLIYPRLRPRLSRRLTSRHLGEPVKLLGVDGKALIAALVTAAVGAVLTVVLVRSTDPGQVRGGLVLGFTLAALTGHTIAPTHRPWLVLLSPGAVAVAGYGWMASRYRDNAGGGSGGDALLEALYTQTLPGVAMGLPVQYATAGVLGCVLGLGIGQVLEKAKLGEIG